MLRGLVSLFPYCLFLSGLSLFFVVQLLCVILYVFLLSDLFLVVFATLSHPQDMAPFGSRPAAGRRARLR
jgi:hypothetical protein